MLRTNISVFALILAVNLIAISCYLLNTTNVKTGLNGFIYPILSATAFSIIAIRLSKVRGFSSLTLELIISIGKVSFSMYLLHFIILDVLRIVFKHTLFKLVTFPELSLMLLFAALASLTYVTAKIYSSMLRSLLLIVEKRLFVNSTTCAASKHKCKARLKNRLKAGESANLAKGTRLCPDLVGLPLPLHP
jgi:peptidoglycan/LPS O-acetylase OafA/YrhL